MNVLDFLWPGRLSHEFDSSLAPLNHTAMALLFATESSEGELVVLQKFGFNQHILFCAKLSQQNVRMNGPRFGK